MQTKFFLLSLGCPRNLVDSEVLTGALRAGRIRETSDVKNADVLIVNTCAFIRDAKDESIDAILEMASLKKKGAILIVAGCLSQRYGKALKKQIPEIDAVFGTSDFMKIPGYVLTGKKPAAGAIVSAKPGFLYDHTMKRSAITPRHFSYLKIQEGCRNNCAYCVIPKLRGPYRSRDFESVVEEAGALRAGGAMEIALVGQDTTLYGIDRYGEPRLAELLGRLAGVMKNRWVRLLYSHPANMTDAVIDAVASNGPVCDYVDLPVQHISEKILKSMNRHVSGKEIRGLIDRVRSKIPSVAIRTSVMVGYPGETDRDFRELVEFVKETAFDRLGAFVYSPEEGTPACLMKGRVPDAVKKARFDEILGVQQDVSRKNNARLMGRKFKVLIDEKSGEDENIYCGRTYMDAPEVDGICYVRSRRSLRPGAFVDVTVTDTLEYDLVGEAA